MNDASFLLLRDHLQNGFTETQRVIHFQDLKASSIIGLSTAIFAGSFIFLGRAVDLLNASERELFSQIDLAIFIVTASALVFTFWRCSAASKECILPRNTDKISLRDYSPNPLFPVYFKEEHSKEIKKWNSEFLGKSDEEIQKMIIEDYEDQATQLGRIVLKKINAVRQSIRWLFFQFIASFFLGCFSICMLV